MSYSMKVSGSLDDTTRLFFPQTASQRLTSSRHGRSTGHPSEVEKPPDRPGQGAGWVRVNRSRTMELLGLIFSPSPPVVQGCFTNKLSTG